jgi:nicotinate-nucleotide pyrophosphorylase (carboxylating)
VPTKLSRETKSLIQSAFKEDLGTAGDLTSRYFVPATLRLEGYIVAKDKGVVAGARIAEEVFRLQGCHSRILVHDGSPVAPGRKIMKVWGGRALLTAERTALNFMQRLSGIATTTSHYVRAIKGTRARIIDTRKTLPGWRELDKYAVVCGGGRNHRMGLYDMVLLKDNHWAAGMDIQAQVALFRRKFPKVPVEIEAATLDQVALALVAGADIVLLDNMPAALLKKSIKLIRDLSKAKIEISGGVNLKTVRALAKLGPDFISVGRLTHSAPALDMSLEVA